MMKRLVPGKRGTKLRSSRRKTPSDGVRCTSSSIFQSRVHSPSRDQQLILDGRQQQAAAFSSSSSDFLGKEEEKKMENSGSAVDMPVQNAIQSVSIRESPHNSPEHVGPLLRSRSSNDRENFGNGFSGHVGTGSPSFTPEGNDDLAEVNAYPESNFANFPPHRRLRSTICSLARYAKRLYQEK